ncbi:AGE family epimerase/isomerase [Treponema sp.]|uniref:AGE family epimerase/isomerase n=1 Tax=Treponema sp. TaxID=166 RepID=UPI00298E848B|nr:AGE family epimerase/isomerase [Treponema sp.]
MEKLYKSVKDELFNDILPYWQKHSRDYKNTGFYGHIDNNNVPDSTCERSIVMTARFLWTYSTVARLTKDSSYLEMADFAYNTIITKYWDKENGGVYWSVLPDGTPKISKKQIYGEAFCCYGLSEYAAAIKELRETTSDAADEKTEDEKESPSQIAMNYALDLYSLLEKHAYDPDFGGYVEARAVNWGTTTDMRLSSKDMNCSKSMNTNLHVMEAYTNLYRTLPVVFPDAGPIRTEIAESLSELVKTTVECILQPNGHLSMFFNMDWKILSDEISYGHDIEASWLLWEAACELNDEELKAQIKDTVIKMAQVALEEGVDKKEGCMENFSKENGKIRDRRRVWWIQAEAINGFYNAWEMTSHTKYKEAVLKQWDFIQNHQIDKVNGEWWNELTPENTPILTESKGGNWKTSYHNARTCIEILRRSHTL